MRKLFFCFMIFLSFNTVSYANDNDYIPLPCAYSMEEATKVYTKAFRKAFTFITMSQIRGDIAEFGTLYGFTASIIAKLMKESNYLVNIDLFDSFEGLPPITSEVDSNSYEVKQYKCWFQGQMAVPKNIPILIEKKLKTILPGHLVHIHKGFFEKTFLSKTLNNKLSIVHIDCDLYQSAKEVLSKLFEFDLIQDGTILLFDDFNCSRANPNFGERRALKEIMQENKRYDYSLFYYYGWHGAAVIIHDLSYN